MKKVVSNYQHLSLYIHRDSLLVYSSISHNLYAFKESDAALFFALENKLIDEEEKQNAKIQYIKDIFDAKDSLYIGDNSFQEYGTPINKNSISNQQIFYKFNNWCFYLEVKDTMVAKLLADSFFHIVHTGKPCDTLNKITVNKINQVYKVFVNEIGIKTINNVKLIVPSIQELVRAVYYSKLDFLVALHAASLEYQGKTLIIPGLSGAGKSTLSTYLSYHGFHLFSDELSVITKDREIVPIPLASSAKESSWKLLESFVKNVSTYALHQRYDNQFVKYIPVENFATNSMSVTNGVILFSRYVEGSNTEIESIDITEALLLIKNSQYHIADPKDVNLIENWLEVLASSQIYKFQYSNLEDALKIIKKVMNFEKI